MNYLTRKDFLEQLKALGMWSYELEKDRALELLSAYEEIISKYEYEEDSNWIIFGRRYSSIESVDFITSTPSQFETKEGINSDAQALLWAFWEFVSEEFPGSTHYHYLSFEEFSKLDLNKMYDNYKEKGIICLQEKNILLEMINKIRNYLNKL